MQGAFFKVLPTAQQARPTPTTHSSHPVPGCRRMSHSSPVSATFHPLAAILFLRLQANVSLYPCFCPFSPSGSHSVPQVAGTGLLQCTHSPLSSRSPPCCLLPPSLDSHPVPKVAGTDLSHKPPPAASLPSQPAQQHCERHNRHREGARPTEEGQCCASVQAVNR